MTATTGPIGSASAWGSVSLAPVRTSCERVAGASLLTAILQFRAGYGDETWATAGWTHLLEHAVLDSLPRDPLCRNEGSVEPVMTTMTLSGEPGAVIGQLRLLQQALVDPPVDDLRGHCLTLAAERSLQPIQVGGQLLTWRFGAAGPGLASYAEPGLHAVDAELLVQFARQRFTAQNAYLVLVGAVPDRIEFALPEGAPLPSPEPEDLTPSAHTWTWLPAGSIAVQGLVEPSPALPVVAAALRARLVAQLRATDRLSYSPDVVHYPAVGTWDAMVVTTDATRDPQATLDATLAVIGDLQRGGFTADELSAQRRRFAAVDRDVRARSSRLVEWAQYQLRGIDPATQFGPTEPAELLREWSNSLVVGVPPGALPPQGHHSQEPLYVAGRAQGTAFKAREWSSRQQITISPGWLNLPASGGHRPIELATVQGMTLWPDGLIEVVDRDGFQIRVEGSLFVSPATVLDHLAATVPAERIVRAPAREASVVPQPRTHGQQVASILARVGRWLWQDRIRYLALLVLTVAALVVMIWLGISHGSGLVVLWAGIPMIGAVFAWLREWLHEPD